MMLSSYVRRQRLINGSIAGLMLAAGLFMMGYGTYTIVGDVTIEIQKETFDAGLIKSCENYIREAQLTPRADRKTNTIEVTGYSLDDAKTRITKTSIAIQQCFGYEMKDFCMGEGCKDETGALLKFTLVPAEIK